MSRLTVVAGPNGSGKSTLTATGVFGGERIDPDAIARRLSPADPSRAAFRAARQTIERCRELLANRESFTLETTLAGHGAMAVLLEARKNGYRTLLVYVALSGVDLHIERVRLRAAQGGQDVPDHDIRRRYVRSMKRAPEALRIADEAVVLDNSGRFPERMLLIDSGQVTWRANVLPDWVQELAGRL